MSLPRSVQEQVDFSNQHFARPENPEDETSAREGERNPPEGGDDNQAPPEGDTASQPDGTDTPRGDGDGGQEPPEPDKDALYWQHRFKVIEGKYHAEVPALRQQVKDLERQVADKETRIKELEVHQASTGNAGELSDDQLRQFREDFGEDLVDFVERMIAQKAKPAQPQEPPQEVSELRDDVEALKQERLDHAKAEFWRDLQLAVPNFREVNNDPRFHQFLAEADPQTGQPRQQALTAAQQALDAKAVIDIFRLYLNQAPAPAGDERPSRVPEENLDPPRSRATDVPPAGGQKLWTGAEIAQFYRDKREGRLGPDEAQRLEADIFAAQQEGRVQR